MGSASCFLRTPHFWNLPLSRLGVIGVALPSGNGGRFYFQPLSQKNGACVMPGARWDYQHS